LNQFSKSDAGIDLAPPQGKSLWLASNPSGKGSFPTILLKTNGFSSQFTDFLCAFYAFVVNKSTSTERETEPAL
jgi:hypothetical protein